MAARKKTTKNPEEIKEEMRERALKQKRTEVGNDFAKVYSDEQLLAWLDDAITKFPRMTKVASISMALNKVGCIMADTSWEHRLQKSECIRARYKTLKNLVRDRIVKHAMFEDPKTQNFARFLLACNHGFIEEHQAHSLELQEKKLNIEQDSNDILRDQVINIGFTSGPNVEPDSGTKVDPYLIEE